MGLYMLSRLHLKIAKAVAICYSMPEVSDCLPGQAGAKQASVSLFQYDGFVRQPVLT